ncbi:MAG: Rpn family recombination-promoting nuclease/putative transposase, partial [Spirochaetaceae bacterium]|nr:Rpn family recombination-promoting nuclease/putative transposase [Spirochaetaceae bacterium]
CGRARLSSTLHEKLIDDGALREHGKLPPVLPIVIYNGGQRWTAAEDVAAMVAFGGEALAAYQPSLRYCLLDEGERAETIFHAETWYRC